MGFLDMNYSREELQKQYSSGVNISSLLRGDGRGNTESAIEVAYDLKSGSYVAALQDDSYRTSKLRYCSEIASTILSITQPKTILEAGVGEGTTLSLVLQHLPEVVGYGFDISWSRIFVARNWLQSQGVCERSKLFTGSIFKIPLPDNSIDVVYTSHSIEPNGGHEEAAVRELYRVAKNWIVLLEPAYDLASHEARLRMKSHGYCVDLIDVIKSLQLEVTRHELFSTIENPMNPTGITIIRKSNENFAPSAHSEPRLCCPVTGGDLQEVRGALFSRKHLAAYPVIEGIPCLREENAVIASALTTQADT
jgi:uncharacterized protein YbaR (Trm112 family)